MTITYSLDVASTRFCGFAKLLGRWKGSIYKILWKEFLVFVVGYTLISVTYRRFLNTEQRREFESVVIYFESFVDFIPLSFVLGFYVSLVIGRWWEQYDTIPWPDRMCYLITAYVHGSDERSRIIRRTLGRYLILMQALTFQSVSTAVKKRFPTTHHFVMAGFMTQEEHTVFSSVDVPYGQWWLPAQWFSALAMRAKKEGRIKDSVLLNGLMEEFLRYRSACGTMFNYDWISVPLVYTQVVTLATYTYSLALMVGRQYLDPAQGHANHKVDLYVPIFTLLQFFFYVGWLKVAEQIVNPYGEDDDDFELNWCLNRSCQVVYLVVDSFHTKHPKLRKDSFYDVLLPELPQTKSTMKNVKNPQLGSAFNLEVNPVDAEFVPMETLLEEDNEANVYHSDSVKGSGVRYRPSFLVSLFSSSGMGGQSLRKRSLKTDSFREQQGGQSNPAFVPPSHLEKTRRGSSSSTTTHTHSRKSSVAKSKSSPSHSRTSSLSFGNNNNPNSLGRLARHKSYDRQHSSDGHVANGVIPEQCESADIKNAITAAIAPVIPNFQDASDTNEPDSGHMPPIPEEPASSRVVSSVASLVSADHRGTSNKSEVQSLLAEANKILEELNKVVSSSSSPGGNDHQTGCGGAKGYESCCSLDDSSDDDDTEDDENAEVVGDVVGSDSVAVEMTQAGGDDSGIKHL